MFSRFSVENEVEVADEIDELEEEEEEQRHRCILAENKNETFRGLTIRCISNRFGFHVRCISHGSNEPERRR
jgi:hypothetical protein